MQTTEHQATLTRYYQAVSNVDLEAFLSCFAEKVSLHYPVGMPAIGRDKLESFFEMMRKHAGDWSIELHPDRIFPGGDSAAVIVKAVARDQQGKEVHFRRVDVFEFSPQSLVRGLKAYWDPAEVAQRLAEAR